MGIIDEIFGDRRDVPLRPAPGHPMDGPAKDPFVASLDDIPAAALEGLMVAIDYVDFTGAPSHRTIRCIGAGRGKSGVYVAAFCLLRRESRSFRIDRIEAVYDYRSGENLGGGAEYFRPYLGEIPDPRPELAYWPGFAACREAIHVLTFLAMSDGELHDTEMSVIRRYAEERIAREAAGLHIHSKSAELWISSQAPTRKQAMAGLRHTMDITGEGGILAEAIFDVMLADGAATDEELALVGRLVGSMERREKKNAQT